MPGKIKMGKIKPNPRPGGDPRLKPRPTPPKPKSGGRVVKNAGMSSKPLTLRQAALRNPVKRGR
jgi:hypothetical protein